MFVSAHRVQLKTDMFSLTVSVLRVQSEVTKACFSRQGLYFSLRVHSKIDMIQLIVFLSALQVRSKTHMIQLIDFN